MTATERKVVELVIDASGVAAGGRLAEAAYDHLGDRAAAAAAKAQAAFDQQVQIFTRKLPQSIDSVASAYDRIRAKTDPILAEQLRLEREMTASLAGIRRAVLLGVTTEAQAQSDISKLRQSQVNDLNRVREAQERLIDAQGKAAKIPANQNQANVTNIAYQVQDIITTAPSMDPRTVGLQQGPQLASAVAGMGFKEAAATLGSAAVSILSPVSLAAIGLTTAAAAAIHYGAAAYSAADKADKALTLHEATLKRIKELYDAASKSSEQFGQRTQQAIEFSARQDRARLQDTLSDQLKGLGNTIYPSGSRSRFNEAQQRYGALFGTVTDFGAQALKGEGDLDKFNAQIDRIANSDPANKKLQEAAVHLHELTTEATKTFDAIKQLNDEYARATTMTARTDEAAALTRYRNQNADALVELRKQQQASLSSIGAISPSELAEAARARVKAEPLNPNESVEVRTYREESAAALALATAQRQLQDAQRERVRSLDESIASQRLSLDLIGKTVGEVAVLRMQHQLESQVYQEAARNHVAVDQAELARIKQKTAEYGRYEDAIARANLALDLQYERDQLSRSDKDQGVAERLRGAGLAVDLGSEAAAAIRATDALREQKQVWEDIRSVGMDSIDKLVTGFNEGFASIGDTVKDIAKDILKEFQMLAIANPLKNAIFGTSLPTLTTAGGTSGFFQTLFGGKNPVASAVASVPVAANDNSNVFSFPSGNLISNSAKAIQSIESGGNYSAIGPMTGSGDRAYGAYQVMGANIPSWTKQTLGQSLSPNQFLGNSGAQDAVFERFFGQSVAKYGNAQDAASVWFTGRPQSSGGGASDILGTTGSQYVAKFNASLNQLNTTTASATRNVGTLGADLNHLGSTAGSATQNLGTFGSGLGQIGSSLQSSGVGSASSGGSWLSKLFGGLGSVGVSPLSPSWSANTTFGAFLGLASGGAFDGGVRAFARGGTFTNGIVDNPTLFRFASGTGLMGEAGPEAIMPLRRDSSGRLGVSTHSPATPAQSPSVNIQIVNMNGSKIEHEETTDQGGNRQTRLVISDQVGEAMSVRGGGAARVLESQYGARKRGPRR